MTSRSYPETKPALMSPEVRLKTNMTSTGRRSLAPTRQRAIRDALNPSGRGRKPFTRGYGSSGHGVTGEQEVEVYRGYSIPPRRERKRESHQQAYLDANMLPTLPEFAKLYAAFPQRGPYIRYGSLQLKVWVQEVQKESGARAA